MFTATISIVRELPISLDHKDIEQYSPGVSGKKIYCAILLTTTVCFAQSRGFFHFTQNILWTKITQENILDCMLQFIPSVSNLIILISWAIINTFSFCHHCSHSPYLSADARSTYLFLLHGKHCCVRSPAVIKLPWQTATLREKTSAQLSGNRLSGGDKHSKILHLTVCHTSAVQSKDFQEPRTNLNYFKKIFIGVFIMWFNSVLSIMCRETASASGNVITYSAIL